MKKIFSIILAFSLSFCLSLSSFAYKTTNNYIEDYCKYCIDNGDGNTYLGTFDTLNFPDDINAFLYDFWVNLESSDYDYVVFVSGQSSVTIFRYPRSTTVSYSIDTVLASSRIKLTIPSIDDTLIIRFNYQTSTGLFSSYSSNKLAYSTSLDKIIYMSDAEDFLAYRKMEDTSSYAGAQYFYRGLNLGFIDNGDIIPVPENPVDPSPDEPVKPVNPVPDIPVEPFEPAPDIPIEPVKPAPDIPVEPVVPSADVPIKLPQVDYNPASVGYDLAIWDNLLLTILPTLRKVFSIILVLFAIMLGFKLFISIVPWLIMGWFRNEKGLYDKKTLVEHRNESSSISEIHRYNHRS